VEDPEKLPSALKSAFDRAPALVDVVVTRDATSPDALSGLPGVPVFQALSSWDKLEQVRRGR
jgi:acetolactate synthase-1/2/3 large subunit